MSKWPKKPLLAVLAALTAVGLGLLIAGCVVLRRRNTSPLDR